MADNPLLKALPPETDYLNYLILLEHNLTIEQLPTLHDILQDTTLTSNIGWDLVHLLLPFLPVSQQCLEDVARLGNPREVVLKVTEILERIGVEEVGEGDEGGDGGEEAVGLGKPTIAGDGMETAAGDDGAALDTVPKTKEKAPSKSVQFIALLEMLSILHPRIKTKYPSRFLSTSLQAILPAYTQVSAAQEATEAVLAFIKVLSGARRPRLPPRKSSNAVLLRGDRTESAPDPEGKDEALAPDEVELQNRLLQSFLTHVTDDYMLAVSAAGEISGLAWSSRLQEKLHPEKIIPGRKPCSVVFAEEDALHGRDAVMGQIVVSTPETTLELETDVSGPRSRSQALFRTSP